MHVVTRRFMRSPRLSEWVINGFSIMFPTWHIRVSVFVVIMDSLSQQGKKSKLYRNNRFRFGYDLKRSGETCYRRTIKKFIANIFGLDIGLGGILLVLCHSVLGYNIQLKYALDYNI